MGAFVALQPVGQLNVAISEYIKDFPVIGCVGDEAAPRVEVARQTFQYLKFDQGAQRLDVQVLRAPGDVPQEDRMTYSTDTYNCKSHALRAKIPYESEAYSLGLGFSAAKMAAKRQIAKLTLAREVYIASLATNPAIVTNNQTLSSTSMWDSYLTGGTSNPVAVVEEAKEIIRQSGVEANGMILSSPVISALKNHPDIKARFSAKINLPVAISLEMLSDVFEIAIYRGGAVARNTNNVGGYVWGQSAVLFYAQASPSDADLSSMKTFVWSGAPDTVSGYGTMTFPDPNLDAKATVVSTDWYWDTKVTAPETMYTFNGCVQPEVFGAVPAPVVG